MCGLDLSKEFSAPTRRQKQNFLLFRECAKDQHTMGTNEISGKWERGKFLVFLKGHLNNLPRKGVHIRQQLLLHEVNGVNNETYSIFSYKIH